MSYFLGQHRRLLTINHRIFARPSLDPRIIRTILCQCLRFTLARCLQSPRNLVPLIGEQTEFPSFECFFKFASDRVPALYAGKVCRHEGRYKFSSSHYYLHAPATRRNIGYFSKIAGRFSVPNRPYSMNINP